jgi:3-hydroxyacyl-[acyl-carrier-protein] dehydratase
MRFCLIDRIVYLESGSRLEAVKGLAMAEEYLGDHFPSAPVMPGVLMLEALVEASAWLIRASEDFAHSVVMLKEARSVKYANFVEPGSTLRITAEMLNQDERLTRLKAQGTIEGTTAVSARLVLERFDPGSPIVWGKPRSPTRRRRCATDWDCCIGAKRLRFLGLDQYVGCKVRCG